MMTIVITLVVVLILILLLTIKNNEHFDFEGSYPYYRKQYSIILFKNIQNKLEIMDKNKKLQYINNF
jgi:hypothetical protein